MKKYRVHFSGKAAEALTWIVAELDDDGQIVRNHVVKVVHINVQCTLPPPVEKPPAGVPNGYILAVGELTVEGDVATIAGLSFEQVRNGG